MVYSFFNLIFKDLSLSDRVMDRARVRDFSLKEKNMLQALTY